MNRILGTASVLFATVVVASMLGLLARAQAPAPPVPLPGPNGPSADPDLFGKIYPVFAHPRCANCHGIVVEEGGQPGTVNLDSHPAAPADDPEPGDSCGVCHNEPEAVNRAGWDLAPLHLRWAGMDKDTLCVVQATEARKRNKRAGGSSRGTTGSYMFHIEQDPFITQAFTGTAGGARDSNPPLPTPEPKRDPFIAAAQEWIDAGAPCRLSGVITQEETMGDNYSFDGPGGMRITVETSANRRVDVARKVDGTATAKATGSGTETVTSVMVTPECTVTTTTFKQWQIVAPPADSKVDVRTSVGDGSYQISVTIPAIKTVETGRGSQTNTCGGPPIDDPKDPINLTWRPWTITINCRTDYRDGDMFCLPLEPQQFSMANGLAQRTIVESSPANDRAWLSVSPQGVGKGIGNMGTATVPIQFKTAWYFLFSQ